MPRSLGIGTRTIIAGSKDNVPERNLASHPIWKRLGLGLPGGLVQMDENQKPCRLIRLSKAETGLFGPQKSFARRPSRVERWRINTCPRTSQLGDLQGQDRALRKIRPYILSRRQTRHAPNRIPLPGRGNPPGTISSGTYLQILCQPPIRICGSGVLFFSPTTTTTIHHL